MAQLQTSGAISLNDIHQNIGGTSGTAVSLNDTDVKELIFYHLIPAPDSFIAKIIFVKGVSEVRPDNWTLADDGTIAILPVNSEDITITNIE